MQVSEELPLVSLVITSYNREESIGKAIESALAQDYPNLEIIIADNCSTDDSVEVIGRYAADSRIKLYQNPANIGMLPNFKKATEEFAKGKWITYVSSDDYLVNSSFVSEAVQKFNEHKTLVVFSGISRNFYRPAGKETHNAAYAYKESRGLLNKLIAGKSVFMEFQYSHLLNFGGSVFNRQDMMDMDIFRENNTTYADLQVILLLALKGDFYLSDKTAYVQTFHNSNASMVFTDAAKAVVNLNFAEIPFAAALEARAFEEKELNSWLDNIVKPFVFLTMKNLYEKDRPGYEKYLMQIRVKYPAVYSEISNSRKWKLMKLIYSNRVTGFLFNQILKIRNAGK